MATPQPCRSLVLLVDALHASAASTLRLALIRFSNLLALGTASTDRPTDVGLALILRSGTSVQLQVVYKPSRFMLRDFQAAVHRIRENEAWASPDTRKLVLALRSLVQHLAAAAGGGAGDPGLVPGVQVLQAAGIMRVVVVAHCFKPPAGGLLMKVLDEAAQNLVSVSFLSLNTEHSLELFRLGPATATAIPSAALPDMK
ncbi:hypothetical protein VaNZ11_014352, partial [Volvox africanus]